MGIFTRTIKGVAAATEGTIKFVDKKRGVYKYVPLDTKEYLPVEMRSGSFVQDEQGNIKFKNSENLYRAIDIHWDGPEFRDHVERDVKGTKRTAFTTIVGALSGLACDGKTSSAAIGGILGHKIGGGSHVVEKHVEKECPTEAVLTLKSVSTGEEYHMGLLCDTNLYNRILGLYFDRI